MTGNPAGWQSKPKSKYAGNSNARVSAISNPFAWEGYYTRPVQKVVSKWRAEIGEPILKRYFVTVARAVKKNKTSLQLTEIFPNHWAAIFELGLAAKAIYGDKAKLPYWLLTLPIHIAVDGHFPSYKEIADMILKFGGKPFSPGAIEKQLKAMRLGTERDMAKEIRRDLARSVATREA
jgi:hypothetical protein